MKILILGANGMLGQALQRTKANASEIVAWDREQCDITSYRDVMEKIPGVKAHWVVNCAAYNAVDDAETNHELAMSVNAQAVGYIAEAVEDVAGRLLHVSTDYVFGGTKQSGYVESEEPAPASVYAQSKRAGELQALASPQSIVVRTSRLFGTPGNGKKSFVDVMLERAKTQSILEVVNEEVSSPTFIDDVARALWQLVEQDAQAGIYHRTNDGACTWYEFAEEIIRLKSLSTTVVPVPASRFPRAAKRPAFSQLLTTKLPVLRNWKEALAQYLRDN